MISFFRDVRSKLLLQLPVANARKIVSQTTRFVSARGLRHQLLVDVSVIAQNDAGTGIQRVVRAILAELMKQLPAEFELQLVYATKRRAYHYASAMHQQLGLPTYHAADSLVNVNAGDVFLGLDLCAHILPKRGAQLERWKRAGVSINVLVYDLLPVQNPEWFYKRTTKNFRLWLRTIAIFADNLICISNTVRRDLELFLQSQFGLLPSSMPAMHVVTLGADIEATLPSSGISQQQQQLLQQLQQHKTVLMVGTLEPRKGHKDVLRAFERLWQQDQQINLVICGKPGWKTEILQQRILQHAELGQRLFWLQDASDETLSKLYQLCDGVVVASFGEGFGLPLFEALRFNKPVLARDLPVFREIAGDQVEFFASSDSKLLAQHIVQWLQQAKPPSPRDFFTFTWHDTVHCLLSQLLPKHVGSKLVQSPRANQPYIPLYEGKL
jgi:glycosyltransferase involved in cell wall biosynthesis